jgi:acetyltransferase
MLYSLRKFPGPLFPINPKADVIQGIKVYPDLKSIGYPVDLVILCIPAKACLGAVKAAGEAGAGAVMIASGGFGESSQEGRAMQNEILAACRQYGIRLLGPNTAGFGNPKYKVTANINPWIDKLIPGGVAVVSQSGSMNLILAAKICDSRLGVSLGVGVGNAADVGIPEILDYLADDEDTEAVALYLEGVSDGRQLFDAIRRTTIRKPVVVFTVGKGDIGEFAASHTGNLIGSFDLKIAALRQAGAVVVDHTNDLIAAVKILSLVRLKPNPNPGIGLLTGQAGPALIFMDFLKDRGVDMPKLGADTIEALKEVLPPITYIQNPVDTARPDREIFSKALEIVSHDPGIDVVVSFAIHEPAAVDPVAAHRYLKYRVEKPMIFGTSGFFLHLNPTLQDMEAMDVPAFVSPDRTARAVRALVEDARIAFHKENAVYQAQAVPDVAPLTAQPDEAQAKALMRQLGIATPASAVCVSHQEAKEAFAGMQKPCVVKVLSPAITHKTEVGGVVLNVESDDDLQAALEKIDAIDSPGEKHYLIEEMAAPGLEIIIGATNDASFGTTVLLGLGGTAAEAFGDVSMRLAPFSEKEALSMIAQLRASKLFDAWRGGASYDKQAVARTLVAIGEFVAAHPEIKEMDLNPVRVYENGVMVLDALMVV